MIPPAPRNRVEFDAREIGFTLKADDQTLREIKQIRLESFRAQRVISDVILD